MTVRLRVAGIYLDEEIGISEIKSQLGKFVLPGRTLPTVNRRNEEVAPSDAITILELMEAIRIKLSPDLRAFTFAFDRRFKFSGNKQIGFLSMISIGHKLEEAIEPSLGGKVREKGFYQLTETPIPNGVVAWQNYIVNKDRLVISSLKDGIISPPTDGSAKGFTSFDQAIIEDGDTVVWRMVAIRRFPDVPIRDARGTVIEEKAQVI